MKRIFKHFTQIPLFFFLSLVFFFTMSLYLDSAATTPLHPEVLTRMNEIADVFGNSNSKHFDGFQAKKILDESLNAIADILHVRKEQLVPTYGGTDANRRVLWAMRKQFRCPNLWCSSVEHSSITDEILETNRFNPFTFEAIVGEPPFLALMHTNNETGISFDISSLKKKYPQALILCDWVQATGKSHDDFRDIDFVSFSAHKIYGPKTVGLLYIKNPDHFPELSKDSHTQNIQLIAGMAKAFSLLNPSTIQTIKKQQETLENFILQKIPNTKIIHNNKTRVPGIINVAFNGLRGSELMAKLSEAEQISVSTGSACSSDIFAVTPSIKVFESNPDFQYPIRIGLHQFVTDEDIQDFCEILEHYVSEMR